MLWWWVLVFQGVLRGLWQRQRTGPHWWASFFYYFHHIGFFFLYRAFVKVVVLLFLYITAAVSCKGFSLFPEKVLFSDESSHFAQKFSFSLLTNSHQINHTVKFLALVCHKDCRKVSKQASVRENHLSFTSVSPGRRIPGRQLTTQQKGELRKSKNNDTNSVQVCVYTLGPVYQDPVCAEASQPLAPQKKNIEHPYTLLAFSLPFFALFSVYRLFFLFGLFLVGSLLERQWP